MVNVKDLLIKFINGSAARDFVKRHHYSRKFVNNSQVHFGVFLNNRLRGVLQYGPSMDKRRMARLVKGTLLNEFLELNRMAFDDALPKNSESRAISVTLKLLKKHYPHLKWVVTFADGTQCGDGTIYRASGFNLIGIKKNDQIWVAPTGAKFSRLSLTDKGSTTQKCIAKMSVAKGKNITQNGAASMKQYKEAGFTPLRGFQIKYIYFLNSEAKKDLTVKILPYSEIERLGAKMYKGKRASSSKVEQPTIQSDEGGAVPTDALQVSEGA